jgi:hypothetical protein
MNKMPLLSSALVALFLYLPLSASANEPQRSIGGYAGKYHDAEPAGAIMGKANYAEHYMVALTGSQTLWQAKSLPVSLEIDGMVGYQWGLANLAEVAVAPALRWSGLPGRHILRTDLRAAPLGLSYTSSIGPLERGPSGQGAQTLNYLFVEAAFSRPQSPKDEFFIRLHHRCAIYDLLNNYGANGEDFFTVGYRQRF